MILRQFERVVNGAILLLLAIVVSLATIELFVLLVRRVTWVFKEVETAPAFQEVLRHVFGASLLVLVGLELMETIQGFREEHRIRLEFIFVVAIIAMCRHAIQMDIEHVEGLQLVGFGVLMAALAGGYWLVRSSSGRKAAAASD